MTLCIAFVVEFEEILQSRKERYNRLRNIIQQLDEKTLNRQVYFNKKTIAEIVLHIVQIDTSPFVLWRIFYNVINLFKGYYSKLEGKDVFFRNYRWNLDTPKKPWKPKWIPKEKLEKGIRKMEASINISNKHLKARFLLERHANQHLRQIEKILQETESAQRTSAGS